MIWNQSLKDKYPMVTDEEWQLLNKLTVTKQIKKGDHFLEYGKIARYAAFTISGEFAFTILNEDGDENIVRFAFADDFLANCESYYQKAPSAVQITALEDSVIRIMNIKKLQPLYNLHMCISDINIKIFQKISEQAFEHQYILSLKSPVKRYKFLLEKRPEIIRRISIKNIAKYLYVSREAISRARLFLLKSQRL
ncbi:Crp/Fnr family transcriptional regulator [Chryseobacterium ginsenosidimutans]|uniref:Crp/Fnr family transcriptional regulator n=1 Tax=Chryseobacterium ginsenosidimutans TaxID=687846 RepID=UPI0031D23F0F